jgi:hypothetical protein
MRLVVVGDPANAHLASSEYADPPTPVASSAVRVTGD